MQKTAIKELMYGGVNELMQNSKFYYRSSVGRGYSKWTDEGQEALTEFISEIAHMISEAQEQDLDQRAKELVVNELKG